MHTKALIITTFVLGFVGLLSLLLGYARLSAPVSLLALPFAYLTGLALAPSGKTATHEGE